MKILTLGGATQDVFIHYDGAQTIEFGDSPEKKSFLLLQEGAKIEIDKVRYSTGGGATNSAVSFKRLGLDVSCFFKIGADNQGSMILGILEQENISVAQCIIDNNEQTGTSYIIPSGCGDRTVLVFRGANSHMRYEEIPFDSLKHYSYIYITSLSGDSSQLLLPIAQHAKKVGAYVVNNPGLSQLVSGADTLYKSLSSIDILILNREEARQFMVSLLQANIQLHETSIESTYLRSLNCPSLLRSLLTYQETCFTIIHFFKEALTRGPKIVVVTNAEEGVYVCIGTTIYFHPSLNVQLVSTLGAGDAFGSAFVATYALHNSIEKAIRAGIINSSSVIKHVDAKEGLLNNEQMERELMKLDCSLLQQFPLP